ncbi:hypothetical protein JM78_11375 [Burkholderia pyrrocinia]|nr:hypothetical protein JM78_11375 [Burkholderia pyrrocinia]
MIGQGSCNELPGKILLHVHLMIDWIRNMPSNQLETLQIVDPIYQDLGACKQSSHLMVSAPFFQKR